MLVKDKLILTDCDGVLLDWQFGFDRWMQRHGYRKVNAKAYGISKQYNLDYKEGRFLTRAFCESAAIGQLPPFKDAVKYVQKLHRDHGYIFDVITSQSNEPAAQELRKQNLKRVFGESVFGKFTILDTGQDKNKALSEYTDSLCWWVEDKPANAEVGYKLGLSSILMEHGHNEEYDNNNIFFAKSWKDIYGIVMGNYEMADEVTTEWIN
jgi:hypothetical protein